MFTNLYIEAFGAKKSPVDVRDYTLERPVTAPLYPKEFILQMREIKNQGTVGSCVAHSLAEVAEYHNFKQLQNDDKMSVGFIYGDRRNSTNKGSGMYTREALSNMRKYGTTKYEDFPYNKETPEIISLFNDNYDELKDKAYPNRFSTYFKLNSDDDIKYALMNYGPVVFAMNWHNDIRMGFDGVIITGQDPSDVAGGHCMVIYGWNENGWLIQNSWGKGWGKEGTAVLPYNIKRTETWGVTDEIISDENTDIRKPGIAKWLAKILNWLLNLFASNK